MKFIAWLKKNYLIAVLFVIAVWILIIKINIKIKDNKTIDIQTITPVVENKLDILISPTPTIISKKTFGNKTKEEIMQMGDDEKYDFIMKLSQEELEELDIVKNNDFYAL